MSSRKVEQAIMRLKELIHSGTFRPGERLPREADLADQIQVSRNSLREAVRAMQVLRVLEVRQGDGTYVTHLDPASMIEVLHFAVDVSDKGSVGHFLDLRRVLEINAVEAAAARRSEADVAALWAVHAKLKAEEDAGEMMALDSAFHNMIAQIAGNPVHSALLRVVSAPTVRARIWRQRMADTTFERIRMEHEAIIRAIEARDVSAARYAMWSHLTDVIAWVQANSEQIDGR